MIRALALLLLQTIPTSASADGGVWTIDRDRSLLAVVTHKAGIAAALAHDHLITAGTYTARLEADPEALAAGVTDGVRFEVEVPVEELTVDDPELERRWYPRLAALGILEEPFAEVGEKDRRKIRRSMLGREQLESARHPTVSVRLLGVAAKPSVLGEVELEHSARLAVTVHGETVEVEAPLTYRLADGVLRVEAVAELAFTAFDIEPYSAALGAVRNADRFHLYLSLRTRPAASE